MAIKVTFIQPDGVEKTITDGEVGESLMELAKANGVEGILGDCGGGCACATCHVYVASPWLERLPEQSEDEEAMLDMAFEVQHGSRLSCQISMNADLDGMEVTVAPDWD